MQVRNGSGGEKTHRMPLLKMLKCFAHTVQIGFASGLLFSCRGVYGHQCRFQWLYAAQQLIYHHFEIRSFLEHYIQKQYAVQMAVGVVAYGYESPLRQIVQPFCIADQTFAPYLLNQFVGCFCRAESINAVI